MPSKQKTLCFIFLLFLSACMGQEESTRKGADHASSDRKVTEKETPPPKSITIAAVGDLLIHRPVFEDAKTSSGYNFTPIFTPVKKYLKETTLTVANQETMIGGKELGLSSYPTFNSPYEVGDALKNIGVDVVSIANNHTLDQGEQGIKNAISHWKAISMVYTGAYLNEQDQKNIRVVQTEAGIDVAFLSYTYGTNGIPVPDGKAYLVNLIDKAAIEADIKKAEKLSDAIVVNVHFGDEYERYPNQSQKQTAQMMADAGADVILGHHPHVLQPIERLEGKNGNDALVIYSLGNFLSAQENIYRRIGGILQLEMEKAPKQDKREIIIKNPVFIPTVVDYELNANNIAGRDFRVLPMSKADESVMPDVKSIHNDIRKHMSQWLPELTFK
ncbi:CapA family protein [Thalassobacillus pellis]|uniref:CapA family protein n=1 Tax=Thalassobacillus pellis TaxID=748008 RepID=UPI0019604BD5|nr:CapA family protein [Thalassobacillus pellis]MBM7551955.1 poly-gamma-glutamate synthesis protein (capsule biosynthesis protein) [Thalassobacillus pellis]